LDKPDRGHIHLRTSHKTIQGEEWRGELRRGEERRGEERRGEVLVLFVFTLGR